MLLCFNNLLAVTWPDRWADAKVGKMTLATRWRAEDLRRLHIYVGALSLSMLFFMAGRIIPVKVVIGSLLSIPFILSGYNKYTRERLTLGPIYAMMVMIIAQSATWFLEGFS
jgi:1,4-dihydroxy-2-naphthoate octaprenyltransferase